NIVNEIFGVRNIPVTSSRLNDWVRFIRNDRNNIDTRQNYYNHIYCITQEKPNHPFVTKHGIQTLIAEVQLHQIPGLRSPSKGEYREIEEKFVLVEDLMNPISKEA